jgi:hypothetical protein
MVPEGIPLLRALGPGPGTPPLEFLHLLVHEMAHEWADRKGIVEVSRGSSYHNDSFRKLALRFLLESEYRSGTGWGMTRPTPRLRRILRRVRLRGAILRRATRGMGPRDRSRWTRWSCRCGPIRVPRPAFRAKCLTCGRRFRRNGGDKSPRTVETPIGSNYDSASRCRSSGSSRDG